MVFSNEKRPLKRSRLGPPDVYPQDPKQKEDELTLNNVKLGFSTMAQLSEEFGTARNLNITPSKIGSYFNAILNKKEELNTLADTGRKRQQINTKDNFWPATARTKNAIENWFKDLAGSKPLISLSKKAPNFNKKEEIFVLLCEYQVPLMRAAWFVKLSCAYTVAVCEAKMKKRQLPDPTQEWTSTLIKFLKDQLIKLQEYYSQSHSPTTEEALRQWQYCTSLAKYLYEEGLLERQELLNWVLELLDKLKSSSSEDGILRLVLLLAMQYLDEFVQSELLSRRLSHCAAKKLQQLLGNNIALPIKEEPSGQNSTPSAGNNALTSSTGQPPVGNSITNSNIQQGNSSARQLHALANCSHHRPIIMSLSCIIQAICLECPTALVWNCVGEGKSSSPLNNSPLDQVNCEPSSLPMAQRGSTVIYRQQVKEAEEAIKRRSRAAENRWSCDKWQQSSDGQTTSRVLNALEALDRHCFDKTDSSNNLDTLYTKIFSQGAGKEEGGPEQRIEAVVAQDEPIVEMLCEWAVSCVRYGEHRAMAVALLLEKRQAMLQHDSNDNDDKDSVESGNLHNVISVYQALLIKWLDTSAPVLEENGSAENRAMFTNLVHLFGELIRHDVFSHDAYMCTLISRGDLQGNTVAGGGGGGGYSNKPDTPGDGRGVQNTNDDEASLFPGIDLKPSKMEVQGHDYDDSKIDDDLDKLLQHIKEEQQNSMDAPDSPKDVGMSHGVFGTQPSRHLQYTTHFPLTQEEGNNHNCNQRHVLLYGVSKTRDEPRHIVRKMGKDLSKLFSKKFNMDILDGGKVKKYSRNEFNFESVTNKLQSLSYYDQHVVTSQCTTVVLEMLTCFAAGSSNYLPVAEHVAFLLDLMQLCFNIHGLLSLCIHMLKELPEVESQLNAKGWVDRSYTTNLALHIVGVLRRYHACLLLSREHTVVVFESLCHVVKHVTNPADCSSAERCILVFLYDLYSSCSLLKCKPHCVEPFQNAYPKIKQALYCTIQPSPSSHVYNQNFMVEVFQNPRRNGKMEPGWARQLAESGSNRYSLVCNAIIAVVRETNNEKLNDIALTCAELTACCNLLSAEWLGVLQSLFSSSPDSCYLLAAIDMADVQHVSIHNSLAVFVSILIARHCFSLTDFIQIAIPPLVRRGKDLEDEAGARLTCHLLLRLLNTVEYPQPALYSGGTSPNQSEQFCMRLSCDRHLLTATHSTIHVGAVLAVLKAIIVVADSSSKHCKPMKKEPLSKMNTGLGGELSISDILGTSDMLPGSHDLLGLSSSGASSAADTNLSLSDFAQHVLKQICSQEWVLERCLQNPEELCQPDMLLDNELTVEQAQRLLHMICYHNINTDTKLDQKAIITRILENLDLWTLRISWLDLQLMYKQYTPGSGELNHWLDTVARAAIDVFQLSNGGGGSEEKGKDGVVKRGREGNMWLVAALVSKLPSAVQGRVLKVAGQVLESGNWSGRSRDHNQQRSSSLLNHQPFLSLVLTCLKGQDEQREGLLTSLHNQLSQYTQLPKDDWLSYYEDGKGRALMQDSLQLRFSLVGDMLDTIQRSSSSTTEWAVLLLQLVTYGVIDLNNNSGLFTTVIDMLATLIHSTLISDSQSERSDENRKHYINLMKKLKKEVGDRTSPSMTVVRQLLPLSKKQLEVVTCQPVGCLTDTKGNKIAGFDSIDKKQGLELHEMQRVAVWEILEGHRNPAPLSWQWFNAVRVERKPLWFQDTHRLLKFHTHNLTKPASYYLDPPPLPPEDLEPLSEKPCSCVYCNQMKDDKADTPTSDTSPRSKKVAKKNLKKRVKTELAPASHPPMQAAMQMQQMQQFGPNQASMFPGGGAGNQGAGGGAPGGMTQGGNQLGGQQWQYNQQMIQQQSFYQQQHQLGQHVGGPRFERPLNQQSKQAITNMLRMRMPTQQFIAGQGQFPGPQGPGQGPQGPIQGPRGQYLRRTLDVAPQLRPQPVNTNMMNMYQNMQSIQPGMNQNYGGYGQQSMNQQTMMSQQGGGMGGMGFGQHPGGFGGGAGPAGGMQRGQEYMTGGPCLTPAQRGMQQQQRPYMQGAPNVTMSMGGAMAGPAPPYPRPPGPNPGQQMNPQQTQQFQVNQRMRLMAMQQGNTTNQQSSPALMAQLQRQSQMSVQNPYQHQPPPY